MLAELFRVAGTLRLDLRWWDHDELTADEQYRQRNKPLPYLLTTIELLRTLGGRRVVEIGAMRNPMSAGCLAWAADLQPFTAPPCCNDGHSTYFWAAAGLEVHSADVDPACREAVLESYRVLGEPVPRGLHLHVPRDGIELLRAFDRPIDLLYLDGWDKGTPGYAEHHLEAWKAAAGRLAENHLVAIDDTDFRTETGGKDALLAPALLATGYVPLLRGRVSVFVRVTTGSFS